jgi:hypothetical protein
MKQSMKRTREEKNATRKARRLRRKEQRKNEALVRQEKYDSLTTAEKIELIKARPGFSKRELARLIHD